jgi:ABC-2 type transport system permease protein
VSAAAAPRARRHRPLVIGRDWRRFWHLTLTLAMTDFKLRFYGSVLGYAWTLVRPFAFFGVVWFVFAEIVGAGNGVRNYPAYILLSLVLFQFFLGIVTASLSCLVDRQSLLRKIRFPRMVIPLSVTLQCLFDLAGTLLAVFIFLALSGVYPGWGWLQLIPLVGILTLFGTGLGLLLSVLFVRFRDMKPIWDVAGQMLFYASPVLYVATMVPESYQRPYLANPVAAVLTQMRHAVIDPTAASASEAIGGTQRLLIPAAVVLATAVLGVWAFIREAPRVAENL